MTWNTWVLILAIVCVVWFFGLFIFNLIKRKQYYGFIKENFKIKVNLDKYLAWQKERYENREDKDNIYGLGMTDSEFRNWVIDTLLPDYYVSDPISHNQINEILFERLVDFIQEGRYLKK